MANLFPQTARQEEIPQDFVKIVIQLGQEGSSSQSISSALGISLDAVNQILNQQLLIPKVFQSLIASALERSKAFRCARTRQLMAFPVRTPDGTVCDLSSLYPSISPELSLAKLGSDGSVAEPELRDQIQVFCRDVLSMFEFHLKQSAVPPELSQLTAECLVVLSPDEEPDTFTRVLGDAKEGPLKGLLLKLFKLLSTDKLYTILTCVLKRPECDKHAVIILRGLLKYKAPDAFQFALGSLLSILARSQLTPGLVKLTHLISMKLDRQGIDLLEQALLDHEAEKEFQTAIEGLKLRKALLCLEVGDNETACQMFDSLNNRLIAKDRMLEFFDRAGWKDKKVTFLETYYTKCLGNLQRTVPLAVMESLQVLYQLMTAKTEVAFFDLAHQNAEADRLRTDDALSLCKRYEAEMGNFNKQLEQLIAEFDNLKSSCASTAKRIDDIEIQSTQHALLIENKLTEQINIVKRSIEGSPVSSYPISVSPVSFTPATDSPASVRTRPPTTKSHSLFQANHFSSSRVIEHSSPHSLSPPKHRTLVSQQAPRPQTSGTQECIYSYKSYTNQLFRTTLNTGETTCHKLGTFVFKWGSCWSQSTGGKIYVTGGIGSNEVVSIDSRTFEVTPRAPMLTARNNHGLAYHANALYAVGGFDRENLIDCERFDCGKNSWERLAPLPQVCIGLSLIVLEGPQCLYALGGYKSFNQCIDLIQRMSLSRLEWDILPIKLPSSDKSLAVFKIDETRMYFVSCKTLFSFHPSSLSIKPVKSLSESIGSLYGPSSFKEGVLYCSFSEGAAKKLELGTFN